MVWPNKPKVVLLPLHISKDDKIYYLKAVFPKRWYGFILRTHEHNIFCIQGNVIENDISKERHKSAFSYIFN